MIWVECSSFLKCCHEVAINCPLQDKSLGWCIKYDQTKSSWNNHQENFLRGEKRHQLGYIVLWWVWAFPGWWRRSVSLAFYLPLWQSSLLPFSCPRHPLKCFLPTKMISHAHTLSIIYHNTTNVKHMPMCKMGCLFFLSEYFDVWESAQDFYFPRSLALACLHEYKM